VSPCTGNPRFFVKVHPNLFFGPFDGGGGLVLHIVSPIENSAECAEPSARDCRRLQTGRFEHGTGCGLAALLPAATGHRGGGGAGGRFARQVAQVDAPAHRVFDAPGAL